MRLLQALRIGGGLRPRLAARLPSRPAARWRRGHTTEGERAGQTEEEALVYRKLEAALRPSRLVVRIFPPPKTPQPSHNYTAHSAGWMAQVQDTSGGCGSMYSIEVVSERFRGLSELARQRLVNAALRDEIRG